MPVTTLESTDQTERVDSNDSASTAGHIMMLMLITTNLLDHRATTTDFNRGIFACPLIAASMLILEVYIAI